MVFLMESWIWAFVFPLDLARSSTEAQ